MSNNLKLINTNTINSKPIRNYIKVKNTGGPKGDTGATGATGPQGPQGPAGQAATINIGETTTLLPGQTATVTNTGTQQNATLNFGIPQGLRGPTGAQGPKGDTGPQGLKGDKGDAGAAATIQVNATNTGAPGTNAQVTNIGNEHFAQLNFTIPRGATGATGAQGPQGPQGPQGEKGDDGAAATVTVGTTATTSPGTSATVTNSGTTSAAVLNFGIPRGATGSVKSEVVSELPESGEGDTFYLVNREATTQTATGKAINFTNSDNSGDITDFQLDGETSQNGTPTPSAPVPVQTVTGENVVKITGKNLLNIQDNIKASDDGLTFSYQNGAITVSGTPSPNSYANVTNAIDTWLQAGTYTLSISSALTHRVYLWVKYSDGTTGSLPIINAGNTSAQATFAKDVIQMRLDFASMTIGTAINETFSVQLEKGSTASTYEPYQGQSYEVNLGKNLFDPSVANMTVGILRSDGTTDEQSNRLRTDGYIPVYPNTTYTLNAASDTSSKTLQAYIVGYRESGSTTAIANYPSNAWYNFPITFTTGANCNYIRISYHYTDNSDMNVESAQNQQLEKGSTATTYAAYFDPIELCKIGDYQDYIYKSGSKWYVHKATGESELSTVDWANQSWGYQANTGISNIVAPATSNTTAIGVGTCFIPITMNNAYGLTGSYDSGISISTSGKLMARATSITDLTTFNTAMEGQSFYYALATPTDTEITNSALITQLDNLASAALYSGVNNIFTVTPNEVPTLELDYVTYDKYNQNKVYIWNDDLQQWQIIVQ